MKVPSAWLFSIMLVAGRALAVEDFISGNVVNATGAPEAGVWVIAETTATPTPLRKIVVTDEAGKFVVPELPAVNFKMWVRGYGLVDSSPVEAAVGTQLTLKVAAAADALEAAQVYPASYWLTLFAPPVGAFGLANAAGEGGVFSHESKAQTRDPFAGPAQWFAQFKLSCVLCHQVGSPPTRLAESAAFDHGFLKAAGMNYFADTLGRARLLSAMTAWGTQLAQGAVPQAPPRPRGIERNFVITQWAWGDEFTYAHDEIATDKRNPTVNANGPVYGVDLANDYLLVVDPNTHRAERIKVPTRDGFSTPWGQQTYKALNGDVTSPYGFGSLGDPWPGGEPSHTGVYKNPANPHNPMMDAQGRVWLTTQIRRQWAQDLPKFCQDDPVIINNHHHRQLGVYDPKSKTWELVDTCTGTHHLQFDADGVIWTSGDDFAVGWFNPAKYDPKNPATLEQAIGYSEVRLDTDGDGKADRSLVGFQYGVIPNPRDRAVWSAIPPGISSPPGEPGWLLRYDPATNKHEAFLPPAPGIGPRGVDVDSTGQVWTALAGSGQLAKFERSRCQQTWGDGAQCSEGWTLWPTPGPRAQGFSANDPRGSTDMHYYLWVDQFDTLGLGKDVVIMNGTNSDALLAFDPKTETFTTIRVPYPLNTYTRGLDGRIDNLDTGWKGRGLWFTNGLDPMLHSEQASSFLAKVQLRPDPLAH
ncbi:MAG: hypothetical protein EXR86_01635 [Gammaproteobacteria bacterium]|nr:hypothetical protein [Gammaproteobacteria bacterium]